MSTNQKLRGFVAQGMSGRKAQQRPTLLLVSQTDSSTGSYTATRLVDVLIYAWGGGGSGSQGATSSGGGGGAAGYKRWRLSPGQTISWSVGAGGAEVNSAVDGNDGGDTTVTIPGLGALTAGGGKKGTNGASPRPGGAGGTCSGSWDVARSGGDGGNGVTGAGTNGGSPSGGGVGGTATGDYAGGGGAAGFSDLVTGISAGRGGDADAGAETATAPGGGSGSASSSAGTFAGKAGRVLVYVVQVA